MCIRDSRDTMRNLKVFEFVDKYADNDELAWTLDQFRPQVLMIHTRAQATQRLQTEDFNEAIKHIKAGLDQLREFFQKHARPELQETSAEILSLEHWLDEVN